MKEGFDEEAPSDSSSSESAMESSAQDMGDYRIPAQGTDEGDEVERFLVIGLSKGSVIFVKIDQIETIYARFNIHKQQIEHIHEHV